MINDLPLVIRTIKPVDIADCKFLSEDEGWNQTEKDWKFIVNNPQNVCLLAEMEHKIIGTATAINYSGKIAWIGMVLVDKAYRGKGIGKMLISNILNLLNSFKSVKLDATSAGKFLYEKIGFKNEYLIQRMVSSSYINKQPFHSGVQAEPIAFSDLAEIVALDASAFGAERAHLIKFLFTENQRNSFCIKKYGKITAIALGRSGRKYQQIGPLIAPSTEEAVILVSHILKTVADQSVVVDVYAEKKKLIKWLSLVGFSRQRDFMRMYLNENPYPGKPENQFLICGPEFG